MTDAFESLLSPFARFGLHTQCETALVMSLALRFLPTLWWKRKQSSTRSRRAAGASKQGSFVVRIKAMVASCRSSPQPSATPTT